MTTAVQQQPQQQYSNNLVILKKKANSDGMLVAIPDTVDDVTFGRAEDCNIRIQKPSVSMLHARIFFDKNGQVASKKNLTSNG